MYHDGNVISDTNDLLGGFWESQETTSSGILPLTPEEKAVVKHGSLNHKLNETGRYQAALPKRDQLFKLDKDYHRLVWHSNTEITLCDFNSKSGGLVLHRLRK